MGPGVHVGEGFENWRPSDQRAGETGAHAPDRSLLVFAGLWEAWKPQDDDAAEWVKTFTVITGKPGLVSGEFHDRQPVILPPADWQTWLEGSPEDTTTILDGAPDAELAFYPVAKAVAAPRKREPELIQPVTS